MEQILCHFFGDFVFQTNSMGRRKKGHFWLITVHALLYVVPFVLLTQDIGDLLIIGVTHGVIDFYRLGDHLPLLRGEKSSGVPQWVKIIYDQGLHWTINYFALRF